MTKELDNYGLVMRNKQPTITEKKKKIVKWFLELHDIEKLLHHIDTLPLA